MKIVTLRCTPVPYLCPTPTAPLCCTSSSPQCHTVDVPCRRVCGGGGAAPVAAMLTAATAEGEAVAQRARQSDLSEIDFLQADKSCDRRIVSCWLASGWCASAGPLPCVKNSACMGHDWVNKRVDETGEIRWFERDTQWMRRSLSTSPAVSIIQQEHF